MTPTIKKSKAPAMKTSKQGRPPKYNFDKMAVGDWFNYSAYEAKPHRQLYEAARHHSLRKGVSLKVYKAEIDGQDVSVCKRVK
jgi:hypothetical protein